MSQFLSPAWLAELGQAVAADERLQEAARGVQLTVGHRVVGGPAGDVAWRMRFDGGRVSVEPGPGEADVEVHQAYATAAAVSRGELAPGEALASGRVLLCGRPGLLSRHREAMGRVGDVFAGLRERTTY